MDAPAKSLIAFFSDLAETVPNSLVITDLDERKFYSQDVYQQGTVISAVIQPNSVADLQISLSQCYQAGLSIFSRGAGLSYTDSYLNQRSPAFDSVLFELSALNEIELIDAENRFVIVQSGCSWHKLHQALQAKGLRTPFWGPLSGLHATIGGALAQISTFLGSAQFGSIADSVLGVEVVQSDGELLRTGSWSQRNGLPFMRESGPDLSGLFIGDAGCLGIKTRIALKLMAAFPEQSSLSFQCPDARTFVNSKTALMQAGLCFECFGFDPVLAGKRMQRAALSQDLSALSQVVKKQGLWAGLKLASKGRGFLDTQQYSLHLTIEAHSKAELAHKLELARKLCSEMQEIENTIPKVLCAQPFTPPNSILGPNGERWVPMHGIVAHSRVWPCLQRVFQRVESHAVQLAQLDIDIGYLFTAVGQRGFLIEPVFYWPDARQEFHERIVEAAHLKRLNTFPANRAASALVDQLKHELATVFEEFGAVHFQLGKFYNYRAGRNPAALSLFDAIKSHLDPRGLFNPGALR